MKIWDELVANGYLNQAGEILGKFDPQNPHFELKVSAAFTDLRPEIIDEINRKIFKNRIVNARDRRELKFRKEVHLSADFQALWDKIKHRTRYRVTFETSDLIGKGDCPHKGNRPHQGAAHRNDRRGGRNLRRRRVG